jgi:hypothetical protein
MLSRLSSPPFCQFTRAGDRGVDGDDERVVRRLGNGLMQCGVQVLEWMKRLALDVFVWTGRGNHTLENRRKKLPDFPAGRRRPIDKAFVYAIFNRDHSGTVEDKVIEAFADGILALEIPCRMARRSTCAPIGQGLTHRRSPCRAACCGRSVTPEIAAHDHGVTLSNKAAGASTAWRSPDGRLGCASISGLRRFRPGAPS